MFPLTEFSGVEIKTSKAIKHILYRSNLLMTGIFFDLHYFVYHQA